MLLAIRAAQTPVVPPSAPMTRSELAVLLSVLSAHPVVLQVDPTMCLYLVLTVDAGFGSRGGRVC